MVRILTSSDPPLTPPGLEPANRPLMIPGQWEARRRPEGAATAAASPVPESDAAVAGSSGSPDSPQGRHTQQSDISVPDAPTWVRVVTFTTVLLALTLIAMWASRLAAS